MIKYASVSLIVILAACSAEVGTSEENRIETLSVDNLVITDSNTAAASGEMEMQASSPAQPNETTAPGANTRSSPTAPVEPKEQAVRNASSAPAAKPKPEPAGQSKAEAEAPADTCTAEHREMGHC